MYDIQLKNYRIKTLDDRSIGLIETKRVSDPSSKRYGETYERVLGYYSSIESAIEGYIRTVLNGPNIEIRSLQELASEVLKIRADLKAIISGGESDERKEM